MADFDVLASIPVLNDLTESTCAFVAITFDVLLRVGVAFMLVIVAGGEALYMELYGVPMKPIVIWTPLTGEYCFEIRT